MSNIPMCHSNHISLRFLVIAYSTTTIMLGQLMNDLSVLSFHWFKHMTPHLLLGLKKLVIIYRFLNSAFGQFLWSYYAPYRTALLKHCVKFYSLKNACQTLCQVSLSEKYETLRSTVVRWLVKCSNTPFKPDECTQTLDSEWSNG